MDTPKKRWFYSIKGRIIGIIVLLLAVPLTVYVVEQQQEIRQRAQSLSPSVVNNQKITPLYPWQYSQSKKTEPVILDGKTKHMIATIPFSAKNCPKRSQGDADCNNSIDVADISFWQIDYEQHSRQFADFNVLEMSI